MYVFFLNFLLFFCYFSFIGTPSKNGSLKFAPDVIIWDHLTKTTGVSTTYVHEVTLMVSTFRSIVWFFFWFFVRSCKFEMKSIRTYTRKLCFVVVFDYIISTLKLFPVVWSVDSRETSDIFDNWMFFYKKLLSCCHVSGFRFWWTEIDLRCLLLCSSSYSVLHQ